MVVQKRQFSSLRNVLCFWLFGLCNNYCYVVMLSAAEDIIRKQEGAATKLTNGTCIAEFSQRACKHKTSTSAVLLAAILPTLIIKACLVLVMHRIPYGFRHFLVICFQVSSFLTVALSSSYGTAIFGVVLTSCAYGLGEATYLSLSSHYSPATVSTWASGTGAAGTISSVLYAALTEPHIFGLSPSTALLIMLIVPAIFAVVFWCVLEFPRTVYSPSWSPKTWIVPDGFDPHSVPQGTSMQMTQIENLQHQQRKPQRVLPFAQKIVLIKPLLKLMVPLMIVYVAEYLINQGMLDIVYFSCTAGLQLSPASQYRWYQVLYHLGVFLSRSSVQVFELPLPAIFALPVLQCSMAIFFFFEAQKAFLPHILFVFVLVLIEGLFGGASYVNTFNYIHKYGNEDIREYSLAVASISDSCGIVMAAFMGMAVHNSICDAVTSS